MKKSFSDALADLIAEYRGHTDLDTIVSELECQLMALEDEDDE